MRSPRCVFWWRLGSSTSSESACRPSGACSTSEFADWPRQFRCGHFLMEQCSMRHFQSGHGARPPRQEVVLAEHLPPYQEDAELARLASESLEVTSPRSLANMLSPILARDAVPTLRVLYIDRDLCLVAADCVRPTRRSCMFVDPALFFRRARASRAAGVLLIQHDVLTGKELCFSSQRLATKFAGISKYWNISLFDHYVVSGRIWESTKFGFMMVTA